MPLEFLDVAKSFGPRPALCRCDLHVREGEVVALLGRRSSGKSTALDLALGLLAPDRGEVRVFGGPAGRNAARRQTGAMLQGAQLPGVMRVRELLNLARRHYDHPLAAERAADMAGLLPHLAASVSSLSAAQRKALHFALAICGRPRLLVLDDVFSGLQGGARDRMAAAIQDLARQGTAILAATRFAEDLGSLASRFCLLSGGQVTMETSLPALRTARALRSVVCRTNATLDAVRDLPEALAVEPAKDGRITIQTGSPELLVRKLYALDNTLAELQVLHAAVPQNFSFA